MSDIELGVRDHIESAYATHGPDPAVTSVVNEAVEQRDRTVRTRDRANPPDHYQHEADQKDRRRDTIRRSLHEEKIKAAAGPSQPARKHEAQPGPPANWNLDAKAQWHDLPQETRLAYQREQASVMNALDNNVKPHLERLAEIDRAIAPSRAVYQAYGVKSDGEAVQRLFEWEHSLRVDPRNGIQRLAQQLGVDLRELVGGPQQYQQYAQQYGGDQDQQTATAVHQELAQFAQAHPHFEQVRVAMGLLLQTRGEQFLSRDGRTDLEKAYREACKNLGVSGDNRARRAANVSSSSRSPARSPGTPIRGGGSVRNSIIAAVNQARG